MKIAKPVLGVSVLTGALIGGFLIGAVNALINDTTPDWDDDC